MVGIRRKIHENLELRFDEFETSKLIRADFDQMGIPYKYQVAETGVGGYIRTDSPPFVAIRVDIGCFCYVGLLQFWDFFFSLAPCVWVFFFFFNGTIMWKIVGNYLRWKFWGRSFSFSVWLFEKMLNKMFFFFSFFYKNNNINNMNHIMGKNTKNVLPKKKK